MNSILWPDLTGRRVLLGVTGGIAAYKSAELCRILRRCGAEVQVMMTTAARQFIGELTFGALSGNPVATALFDPGQEHQIGHIALADGAELIVLAPATADTMAKLAHGMADDLVSTVCLAFTGKMLIAPAMNVHMWAHPATQQNLATLLGRGCKVVGPAEGEMACGHVGQGRMAEPEQILQALGACLTPQDLAGRSVLVTAGPTHEALDPVRYLGNRSSGKMGFAIAAEVAAHGGQVTLVAGPSTLSTPHGVTRRDVTTAAQMSQAVGQLAATQDAIVMAAAVADYRPKAPSPSKLKKEAIGQGFSLDLERTEDILAMLGTRQPRPLLVGFAAETGKDLRRIAAVKQQAKGCDLLVANDVTAQGAGFEVDTNKVLILDGSGQVDDLPLMSKRQVAEVLVRRIVSALEEQRS